MGKSGHYPKEFSSNLNQGFYDFLKIYRQVYLILVGAKFGEPEGRA